MRKVVVAVVLVALALPAAGALYQWLAQRKDANDFPMPGQRLDVGGRSLHLYCSGTGTDPALPVTVVLESGLTAPFAAWRLVQHDISRFARVCSYDRAGLGWSDPAPGETRVGQVVDDLARLLTAAHIDGPLVLVGWSAGGVYVQAFAARYPDRVHGLVLVDASHESQGLRLPPDNGLEATTRMLDICRVLGPIGAVRALGVMRSVLGDVKLPDHLKSEQLALFNRTAYCSGVLREISGFAQDVRRQPESVPPGSTPLIVISRGKPLALADMPEGTSQQVVDATNQVWSQLQVELAARSTRSEHWIANHSGHAIPYEEPEIIVRAVEQLLANDSGPAASAAGR